MAFGDQLLAYAYYLGSLETVRYIYLDDMWQN